MDAIELCENLIEIYEERGDSYNAEDLLQRCIAFCKGRDAVENNNDSDVMFCLEDI